MLNSFVPYFLFLVFHVMKIKGIANDMTGVIANSTEDVERPNRALSGGQPWVDSAVNIHVCEAFFSLISNSWPYFNIFVFNAEC